MTYTGENRGNTVGEEGQKEEFHTKRYLCHGVLFTSQLHVYSSLFTDGEFLENTAISLFIFVFPVPRIQ